MVKRGSQAIFLYKFPPMGLLDPLTEYLQARGEGWWPFGIPRTGPGPDDVSRPGQDAYIQDTPLDLAAVDELLQENEYLGNQNFGGLDVCVDFLAFIKKCVCLFCVKGECSQFCWRPLGDCFFTFHGLTSWNLQGMISNHFQQDLSSCGLVTRFFAGSHKHQLCSPEYPLFVDRLSS